MDNHPNARQLLRTLPSVDKLLLDAEGLVGEYGRLLTTEAIRHTLDQQRQAILTTGTGTVDATILLNHAHDWLDDTFGATLRPVINGTGVIVHTNLGRAPLSAAAVAALTAVSSTYSTLEYDPVAGQRGSRTVHGEQLLNRLTDSAASLVVNNNAAAVLLMLTALCHGREVIISRGQLVEIGGGFRIPDVMAQSGAKLVEVGTTNKTHLRDYANAISDHTAAILVAHHSNYKIIGFTSEPTLAELAELAHAHHLPLLYDQGSGALLDVAPYGLEPEPTVTEGLAAGCDVVAFSGDKLLGGPQAGIVCGRADLIAQLKRHPLARAVRADKLCLAALAATLRHYAAEEATSCIPVWQMIAAPLAAVTARAEQWAARLAEMGIEGEVMNGRSTVGGGSLPGTSLPTTLLALPHPNPDELAARLRGHNPPLIGRIQNGRFLLDPRTVLPGQEATLLEALGRALAHSAQH